MVRAGEAVDKQVLADALWGDDPPATWPKMVQGCIVRLRRRLPPGRDRDDAVRLPARPARGPARRTPVRADARPGPRAPGRPRPGPGGVRAQPRRSRCGAGRALPDLDGLGAGTGRGRAARRACAWTRRSCGSRRRSWRAGPAACVEDARALTQAAPFRERRWALLARALYQSGRQTEALDVLARARRMLRDELGLDPGPELLASRRRSCARTPRWPAREAVETSPVCPYRGLLPYEADDAESFFGRDADVAACLEKLRAEGVLAVVGALGHRQVVAGARGRRGLARARRHPGAGHHPGRPTARLAGRACRRGRRTRSLVVDQAEEAVTLCTDPAERAAYFAPAGRLRRADGDRPSRRPARRPVDVPARSPGWSSAGCTCSAP